jgi:uncharacterized membrane protein
MFNLKNHFTVKDIALIALLTALSVGGSYALIGLPNINLMDIVVFVTSFVFGIPIGVAVSILSWSIYGIINPLGFVLPIWISTIIGESLFGFVGGILGMINPNPKQTLRFSLEMGLWGLGLTIIYDLFTNIVFAYVFNVPIIASIVSGWFFPPWFGILHGVSNLILFSSAVYPLSKAIRITRGGE